ncbi:MAG TPA: hypothetical protein VLE70_20795 [Anaerolineae bacterium]|nr:hypothetical protein [Anaerolineae bacterium]
MTGMVVGAMPFVIVVFSVRPVVIVFSVRHVILMIGVRPVISMFSVRLVIIISGVRFVVLMVRVSLVCASICFQITNPAAGAILFSCQCVMSLLAHAMLQRFIQSRHRLEFTGLLEWPPIPEFPADPYQKYH